MRKVLIEKLTNNEKKINEHHADIKNLLEYSSIKLINFSKLKFEDRNNQASFSPRELWESHRS